MRIEGGARAPGAGGREAGPDRFGEALARAGGRERGSAPRGEGTRPSGPAGGARRPAPGGAGARDGAEGPAAATGAPPRLPAAEIAPVPEVAQLARAAAPAAVVLAAPGAPLALSFGRSLAVELRATAAGVEVILRPDPGLARAADAELPRLVAALRGRGVAVASASIRGAGSRGGRAR